MTLSGEGLAAPPAALPEIDQIAKKLIEEKANAFLAQKYPFIKIKYVNDSTTNGENGWAAEYDWSRTWGKTSVPNLNIDSLKTNQSERFRFAKIGLKAHAKGNYAYGNAHNTQDLSTAGVSFGMDGVDLGLIKFMTPEDQKAVQECTAALDPLSMDRDQFDKQAKFCGQRYFDFKRDNQRHAYAYRLAFDYNVEATDNYKQNQEVYGAGATFAFEPYADSLLQDINVFDYPFRYITRPLFSDSFTYNANYPSVHLAFEQVDPEKNTARNQLPEGSEEFERLHLEVSFAGQMLSFAGIPVTFGCSYRLFHEISAPQAIKNADLDRFEYATAMIYIPAKLFALDFHNVDFYIGYTHGELPFDRQTNKAVEIGWRSNLSLLAEALLQSK